MKFVSDWFESMKLLASKKKMQPYLSSCLVHISFNIKCLNNCQHIKWIEIRSKTSWFDLYIVEQCLLTIPLLAASFIWSSLVCNNMWESRTNKDKFSRLHTQTISDSSDSNHQPMLSLSHQISVQTFYKQRLKMMLRLC